MLLDKPEFPFNALLDTKTQPPMPVNQDLLVLLQAVQNSTDPFLVFLYVLLHTPYFSNLINIGSQQSSVPETPLKTRRSH